MESFFIKNALGVGSLEFFDRSPADPDLPIETFWVRITDRNFSAAAMVYSGYFEHPAPLFVEMAEHWRGWPGELQWSSFEGEMGLACTADRTGHVSIRITLRSGWMESDWSVKAAVMAEAGQLEEMSRRAASFFGRLPTFRYG